MKNKERIAKEITEIACFGEHFSIQRGRKTPIKCSHAICEKCLFFVQGRTTEDWCSNTKRMEWVNRD